MGDRRELWACRVLGGAGIVASALAIATALQPAYAQTAETEEAAQSEDIIVTARRQEERLQDVPAAVSAFGAQSLYENQIETIGDLQSHVPNLSLHVGDASNAVIYVRGIGQIDSISFNDPGVGVYLDDVYLGRVQGSFLDVVDPQQIEVLRGPQGTLYGRNTVGGAVKFTSAMPSDHFEGYVEGAVGNYDEQRLHARVSGPLTPDGVLRGSLAASSSVREGYTDNLNDGQSDGDKDLFAWRGTLLLEPNDSFSAYLTLDGSRNRPDRSRTPHRETPIFSPILLGAFRPVIEDPFTVDVTYNDLERLDTQGASLTLAQEFGNFTLKSITAYREMDYRTHLDLDGSPDQTFGIYDFEQQDQTSQEFQLLYNGDRLSFVAGIFYFQENDWTFGGAVAPDYSLMTAGLRLSDNEAIAAYAQADWRVTDRASITLGARYTHERKWMDNRGENFLPTDVSSAEDMERLFGTGAGFLPTAIQAEETWNSLTPRIGFNYEISDDTLFYISAAQGFKSGGFNGRSTDEVEPFEPETLWSYEAGLKMQTHDGRMHLNTAVFFQEYEDMQVSRFTVDDMGSFDPVFDNAGGAEMYGLETEFDARLTDAFLLEGNLAYLHSEYTEFVDGGVDVSDRALVNAPEWSGRLGATYDLGLGGAGDLRLRAGASYRSKTYLTVSASEVLAQDAVTLFDASIIYTPPSDHWSFVLSGQNLTDEAYMEHGFDLSAFPGVQLGYYAAPLTYSLSARYRF